MEPMVSGPGASTSRWDVSTENGMLACYDATFTDVYRYARWLSGDATTAEDLTQETFLRLVRAGRDGQVGDIGIGWLMATLRNLFVDQLRSEHREHRRLQVVASRPADDVDDPSAAATDLHATTDALEALSPRQRAALVFRYVDDLSVGDVAELLGLSVRATESLLQRAKQAARKGRSQ